MTEKQQKLTIRHGPEVEQALVRLLESTDHASKSEAVRQAILDQEQRENAERFASDREWGAADD